MEGEKHPINKKLAVATFCILALIIGGVFYYVYYMPRSVTSINVAFDWFIYGKFAMFYPAQQFGWYKDVGLDVTFLPGAGSADNVKRLLNGEVQFAFVDGIQIVVAKTLGVNLTAVGAYHDKNPVVVYAWNWTGVKEPKDLDGKTIITAMGGDENAMLPIFLKKQNVTDYTINTVDFPTQLNGFISNATGYGIIATYVTVLPNIEASGVHPNIIWLADYGLDVYSNVITCRTDYLKAHSDIVAKFVNVTYRSVKWSLQHQAQAFNIFMTWNPSIANDTATRSVETGQFNVGIELINTTIAQQHTYGYMTLIKWEDTSNMVYYSNMISAPLTVDQVQSLYTNQYLP